MAITDLTNTKWLFNESIDAAGINFTFNYKSNGQDFSSMVAYMQFRGYSLSYDSMEVYYSTGGWVGMDGNPSEAYRTIEITGGTDATNTTFITWLQNNATQLQTATPKEQFTAQMDELAIAINEKAGGSGMMTVAEMIAAVRSIQTGGAREGTPAPNSGVVDKIYFNFNKTKEEIVAAFDQLTFVEVPNIGETYAVSVAGYDDVTALNNFLLIRRELPSNSDEDGYVYSLVFYRGSMDLTTYPMNVESVMITNSPPDMIWYFLVNDRGAYAEICFAASCVLNANYGSQLSSFQGIPVGQQNELIKNIISSTPFYN